MMLIWADSEADSAVGLREGRFGSVLPFTRGRALHLHTRRGTVPGRAVVRNAGRGRSESCECRLGLSAVVCVAHKESVGNTHIQATSRYDVNMSILVLHISHYTHRSS